MNGMNVLKKAAIGLACWGVLLPQSLLAAAPESAQPAKSPVVHDVKLADGGTLTGFIVNDQGVGTEGAVVSIRSADQEVAQVVTDENGRYVAQNLRGGTYQIVAGQGTQFVRAWAPGTAPPAARDQALLVNGSAPVRGQWGGVNGVEGATLGISIASLVIGIITLSKVNDNNDAIISIQTGQATTNENVLEILETVSP